MNNDPIADIANELLDVLLYENEPPKPQQPWENLSDETRQHYAKFARNLVAHWAEVGLKLVRDD